MKVLVTDSVSQSAVDVLKREPDIEVEVRNKMTPEEFLEIIPQFDALIVRSATKVTREVMDVAANLKVIGRAGVGVDNIDVTSATERGIIVVNAPEGNTNAATELTMAHMLGLARNLPQADSKMKAGVWDKKAFVGVELRNKTLGILGLGRIGSGVAKRAEAMEMNVIAYDPFLTEERAREMSVKVLPLDEVFREADFITVHMPLTKETKYMIDARAIGLMKEGVRIINCARGGIIDESALYQGLISGKVAGAALDVFECEPATECPLLKLPNVIGTPHLGASTREAQVGVAVDVAEEIIAALRNEIVKNAVNIPSLKPDILRAIQSYLPLAEVLGKFHAQLLSGRVQKIEVTYSGELAGKPVAPLTTALVKGILDTILQERVNFVNAMVVARNRGIQVSETKVEREEDYAGLMTVKVISSEEESELAGTLSQGKFPRVVAINGYRVDTVPEGHMLVVPHYDRPKIIGRVGMLIGAHDINIAAMQVGRKEVGGKAVMVLTIDSPVPAGTLEELGQVDGILGVKMVSL
ncbi:MAG: phosphoglycerate dehydrogenase [Eubacteriales bacterium]|jgi:D-3-phosphoglycerate dehydrogenase|nr:phosphoglycerate dehydrogenase [Bacillota bacterium]MBV1727971.1 phosphoglycerate dehydrogenase [Desulforudis sp.]MDQ7789078.1 phosphoglycerate dehydrogenase [Clostridia bacterium]MDZ4042180.1 phosphoglycerate dehydrogenase [Eubacteriales bacterium]MBU4532988.1 phosphoglycerate dehydrogenase [Bacillota bacterium]